MKHKLRLTRQLRTTGCAVLMFIGIVTLAAAQAPEWKAYTYASEGFSISLPSAPQQNKDNVVTDAGTIETRSYLVELARAALFIGVSDFDKRAAQSDPDKLLQGARDGALQNSKSHLVSEKKLMLGIYPGIEFEGASDEAHFTARVYLVGTRMYQTLVVAPIGQTYDGASRFLDSFQLIPRTNS
jgi:NADH dehydrogenase/NADH:ubiquinone oxidoreductase subunit G